MELQRNKNIRFQIKKKSIQFGITKESEPYIWPYKGTRALHLELQSYQSIRFGFTKE